jgi:hypothetical protein
MLQPTTDKPNANYFVRIADNDQCYYVGFDTFADAHSYVSCGDIQLWYTWMTADVAPRARIDVIEICDRDDNCHALSIITH